MRILLAINDVDLALRMLPTEVARGRPPLVRAVVYKPDAYNRGRSSTPEVEDELD